MRNIFIYILFFALLIPFLLLRDYSPTNELRYVGIVQEAMSGHRFFSFFLNEECYAEKPPFFFWLMMAVKWMLGSFSVLSLGLLNLIPSFFIVLLMNKWTANILSKTERMVASAMLLTTGMFLASSVIIRMDMLMTFFIVLTLYTFFRIYQGTARSVEKLLLPIYLFMGMFTKWPVGAVIPILAIGGFLLWKRELFRVFKFFSLSQIMIFLFLTAAWWLGAYLECGKEYLNNLLFVQTFGRAVHSFHHQEPFYYYLVTMWYGFAPWIIFYLGALFYAARNNLIQKDIEKLFVSVVITIFVFMSAMSSKIEIYLLPIYPFLAFFSIMMLKKGPTQLWSRVGVLIPGVILLLALPVFLLIQRYLVVPEGTYFWVLGGLLIVSLSAGYSLWLKKEQMHVKILVLSIGILVGICFVSFALPRVNGFIGLKQVAEKADEMADKNNMGIVYFYPFRSAEFLPLYVHRKFTEVDSLLSVQTPEKQLLIIDNHEMKKRPEVFQGVKYSIIYSSGKYSIVEF